jgi:hypothetical protein
VGKTIFERLNAVRPPARTTTRQSQTIWHAQRLLDWLQSWPEPTISARQICIYGPRPIRKREKAGNAAAILIKTGWLIPLRTHRYDMEAWRIVRAPILYPDCSRVADASQENLPLNEIAAR